MLTMRTFAILLHGHEIDRVCFIGEEYTESTVRDFMIETERMDRDIIAKLVREVTK